MSTLRFTGIAAIVAGGVHLLQFAIFGIGPALNEPEFPDAAAAGDNFWFGVVGTLTFTSIALAYLAFFPAATALTRTGNAHDPIWRSAMQMVAGVGIGAWLLAGAGNLARRGFNATAIDAASGGDAAIGRAVLQGAYLTTSAAAIASALAFAIWFIAFAVRGRRAGAIGRVVAVAAALAAVVPLLGWALDIGGIPMIAVSLPVIGIALLARDRRQRVDTDAAPGSVSVVAG